MQGSARRSSPANFLILFLLVAGILPICFLSAKQSERKTAGDTPIAPPPKNTLEAISLTNIGVAYMNQQRFDPAHKSFEQALAADAKYALARLNLGISLHSQQKPEEARTALEQATQELPADPYGWYNLGLVYKDLNETEKAIAAFQRAAAVVPSEADPLYFLGLLLTQQQKYDEAIAAFQHAVSLNVYHPSAEFGLARALQRKGEMDAARAHLLRFQKITQGHLGSPFGAGYGDQGRFSQAEPARGASMGAPNAIAVRFDAQPIVPRGTKLQPAEGHPAPAIGPGTGACFFDFDGDGRPDLFLVSAIGGATSRLLLNMGNEQFADVSEMAGLHLVGAGLGCAAGDFDNDGHTDLAVCLDDGVHLLRNLGSGKFADVMPAAGIRREKGCVSVTFVDYDHDGDLDLYVVQAPDDTPAAEKRRNVLWRNNADGTFTDISAETALDLPATGAGVVTTDFNNDRAIDFVFAGGDGGGAIYLNPREGKFTAMPGMDFKKEGLPPAAGVIAFDFDKDGWMDLAFTHAGAPGISLWRNVDGKRLERVALPDFGWQRGWGITAVDYDNDGWLDLVAAGETKGGGESRSVRGELRLLRNLGPAAWSDVTKNVHLDAITLQEPRAVALADVDGDGGADLMVTQLGGPPLILRNQGGNRRNWLRVDFKSLSDNKSAIGTKVEVYAGPLYQKWEVQGASGYLGQNAAPILAGLGSERQADVVRLLWPTGVPQDEIELAGREAHTIAEIDRRGSSCPVLFAWNGREYEFIADMIGPGVVGHWVAPGERDVPDPDEYLKVPGRSVRPRNGLLSFRFMEPMEETVYLDQVRLLAIDHPAALEVYPNERFASAPPFPEFRVMASRDARLPPGAWDERGNDVLPLLLNRDRKYVTGFEELPFAGFAKLHWIELDLGAWDAQKPLRLLLDGYTDYFTATSMYAADQGGIKVIAPYVEAQDAHGKWVRVVDDLGFPAGLARTMVGDLSGKLPPGTRRIRIVTNLKIYWDRVRIDATPAAQETRVSEVPLANALLDDIGYPREFRGVPASDTWYSYANRSRTGPYTRAAGNYTRFGDVDNLLRATDDRFAVFGSSEGVKLNFDPHGLPPLPAGWVRDYFFYANGFEKDLDFYAAHAFTVGPLPYHTLLPYPYAAGKEYPADAEHVRYELEYNTRQRSGQMPPSLRYNYSPHK